MLTERHIDNTPVAEFAVHPELRAADSELLMQFVQHRDEDAFSELVARHAPMVLGVCTQILRDRFEAEDVFQATFLILAQKAHKIKRSSSLSGWLHQVASRAAWRAFKQKPRHGDEMQDIESPESEQWLQIAEQEEQIALHEELNRLPAQYRDVLVLCYLEGKTRVEAADYRPAGANRPAARYIAMTFSGGISARMLWMLQKT